MSSQSLSEIIAHLSTPERVLAVRGIRRGVEREALRITADGQLSSRNHPEILGAALTHANITTDYSESLMEFITPVSDSHDVLLDQLGDIHQFTQRHIGDERLWPFSMPCFIGDESSIRLAQYGTSNTGRLKTTYRQGLHHRYGSMMQVIAGVHFNVSMPDSFWKEWRDVKQFHGCQCHLISDGYMGLIRNVYRFGWLIPYLFGASPAICSSFLQGRDNGLPFEKMDNGTLYLPYATSLRLSDLGYTNKSQAKLAINHNSLKGYLESLRHALRTKDAAFTALGIKDGDDYRQLNDHVLQLENELYAPIRPKRTPRADERPLVALERRGIDYIELRTLDLNPFSPVGVDLAQLQFLDIFVLWCLLRPSPAISEEELARGRRNLSTVAMEGRKPGLCLQTETGEQTLRAWGESLFTELTEVAQLLDRAYGRMTYQNALQTQWAKFTDPSLTPSAQVLAHILPEQQSIVAYGRDLAEQYHQQLTHAPLRYWEQEYFLDEAEASLAKQRQLEAEDYQSFDDYVREHLRVPPAAAPCSTVPAQKKTA